MPTAPEPYLSAGLATIREAVLMARACCWRDRPSVELVADLMDAVHNLPDVLVRWETCDLEWLRRDLAAYDRKWGRDGGWSLLRVFDQAVEAGQIIGSGEV
jgi:hypothetical protein